MALHSALGHHALRIHCQGQDSSSAMATQSKAFTTDGTVNFLILFQIVSKDMVSMITVEDPFYLFTTCTESFIQCHPLISVH